MKVGFLTEGGFEGKITLDNFNIRTDANNLKVEIHSTLGKLITKTILLNGIQQIDLSNEAKGIYFVKLIHDGKIEQRKILVQ